MQGTKIDFFSASIVAVKISRLTGFNIGRNKVYAIMREVGMIHYGPEKAPCSWAAERDLIHYKMWCDEFHTTYKISVSEKGIRYMIERMPEKFKKIK